LNSGCRQYLTDVHHPEFDIAFGDEFGNNIDVGPRDFRLDGFIDSEAFEHALHIKAAADLEVGDRFRVQKRALEGFDGTNVGFRDAGPHFDADGSASKNRSGFLGISYGFRPGRGTHDALDALCVGIDSRKVSWILDADIRSFFDEISQEWLIRFLEHRIGDRRIIRLIQKWLKAGVLEDGVVSVSDRGTGQGSVISPLLANIYLHYTLDLWAMRWRRRKATGDMIIVRYADDFIVGFQHESDARRFLDEMRERLQPHARNEHRRHQAAPGGDPGVSSACCCAGCVTVQVAQRGPRCVRVDSRLDTEKICSDGRVGVDRPGCVQFLGEKKRFHTAWVKSGREQMQHREAQPTRSPRRRERVAWAER
jgi:hypothetical protein